MDLNASSSTFCPKCDNPFTFGQLGRLMCRSENCSQCGEKVDAKNARAEATPGQDHLVNTESARAQAWYHASNREDWLEGAVDSRIFVHVGTKTAAIERARVEHIIANNDKHFYLYEVRLSDDAILADTIVSDSSDWAEGTMSMKPPVPAQRYVNFWESPGSISIIIDPRLLVQTSCVKVSG